MNRIEWVDIAKGLGIILVVLGHTSSPEILIKFIFAFHMPLFFFLSGYLHIKNKYPNFKKLVSSKSRSLLIPYMYFSIILYSFWLIAGRHLSGDENTPVWKPFIGIFYSIGEKDWMVHASPLWFLSCLFMTECIFYILTKYSVKFIVIFTICLSLVGYFYSLLIPIRLPWSLDVALTGVVFYSVGFLFRQYFVIRLGKFLLPILLLSTFIISQLNESIDLNTLKFNNYFYFYMAAFTGILSIIIIAQIISNSKTLSFLGRNSIMILALHLLTFSFLKGIMVFVFNIDIKILEGSLIWGILFTLSSLFILTPVILIIKRHFFFILGEKKSNVTYEVGSRK